MEFLVPMNSTFKEHKVLNPSKQLQVFAKAENSVLSYKVNEDDTVKFVLKLKRENVQEEVNIKDIYIFFLQARSIYKALDDIFRVSKLFKVNMKIYNLGTDKMSAHFHILDSGRKIFLDPENLSEKVLEKLLTEKALLDEVFVKKYESTFKKKTKNYELQKKLNRFKKTICFSDSTILVEKEITDSKNGVCYIVPIKWCGNIHRIKNPQDIWNLILDMLSVQKALKNLLKAEDFSLAFKKLENKLGLGIYITPIYKEGSSETKPSDFRRQVLKCLRT